MHLTKDESGIRVWDLRMSKFPIADLPGHAHWTWAMRCNPEYDRLILSAGTDSNVNLWFTSVRSSDTPESPTELRTKPANPLLRAYSDYEDSVYGNLRQHNLSYAVSMISSLPSVSMVLVPAALNLFPT
ncbi:hypothetical protein Droror1_Dr00000029 [Drosera rotundifolia]